MGSATALQRLTASGTIIAADTADFRATKHFSTSEGTTNPSLLYAAASNPQYKHLLEDALSHGPTTKDQDLREVAAAVSEYLSVAFGVEILKCGYSHVATEIDVRLSFDTGATIAAALRIIDLYKKRGISADRVRIKISATWEGIQAAKVLENEYGVGTLVTVVFGMAQAVAASQANVSMIAPYVGRIGDWHAAHGEPNGSTKGIEIVAQMQGYLRSSGSRTKLMGASFRSPAQVMALEGADYLTIGPSILENLETMPAPETPCSVKFYVPELWKTQSTLTETAFRWAFNQDACAVEKSAEAMRKFGDDTEKLEELLLSQIEWDF